jgi:hypothetical protein
MVKVLFVLKDKIEKLTTTMKQAFIASWKLLSEDCSIISTIKYLLLILSITQSMKDSP